MPDTPELNEAAEGDSSPRPCSPLPFAWREVQSEPLIYEAEVIPHHRYLLIHHDGLWVMSKMVGQHYKRGSTLSPRPEPMEDALTRAHEDWANDQVEGPAVAATPQHPKGN
jgi:hypothetical protein